MGGIPTKHINQDLFKKWDPEMSYVLGYIVADGCIIVSKDRKGNPFSLNITSVDKKHLYRIRDVLESEHKVSTKSSGASSGIAYQLQIRNLMMAKDLMRLGVFPRKTYNLGPIKTPKQFLCDFARGFFDGDGSFIFIRLTARLKSKRHFATRAFLF